MLKKTTVLRLSLPSRSECSSQAGSEALPPRMGLRLNCEEKKKNLFSLEPDDVDDDDYVGGQKTRKFYVAKHGPTSAPASSAHDASDRRTTDPSIAQQSEANGPSDGFLIAN